MADAELQNKIDIFNEYCDITALPQKRHDFVFRLQVLDLV